MTHLTRTLAAGIAFAGSIAASAATPSFATFADPSHTAATPLFTFDKGLNQLSGSWTLPGLTLHQPLFSTTASDVRFTMAPVSLTSGTVNLGTLGPGSFTFEEFDGSNWVQVLRVAFTSATLTQFQFAAGAGDGVEFFDSLDNPLSGWTDKSFAFSLTNRRDFVDSGRDLRTYTASFGSTASPVPEPAAAGVLGVGALALMRRRRSR
ncbi:MAG: PEP-CTERM sorting domain-containing protein [Fimbriimonadaceae bacterium]